MQKNDNRPLSVSILGMDGRSLKMMVMFLQGPCKGKAIVVNDDEADVDIIDGDSHNSKALVEQRKSLNSTRPLIVLSLQPWSLEDAIFVQKPVQTLRMMAALKEAQLAINAKQKKAQYQQRINQPANAQPQLNKAEHKPAVEMITRTHQQAEKGDQEAGETESPKKVYVNTDEQKKTSKHKTAMHLDEKSFSSFIGLASGVDFEDAAQLKAASYNAKQYYQGYVQSAFKLATSKKRVVQLNSGWRPLIIFPSTHEIWVDADDKQLRSFSSVVINNQADSGSKGITVVPYGLKKGASQKDLTKFQTMDGFIWKLAIWTSKGRFPQNIDIDMPVYLKRWPNFTRLTISPHSLRIAALLMEGPRSLANVAQVLNIKPQYVFAFFSAAYAIGLAGQAERKSDLIVAPEQPKVNKKKGLLNKIMRKLRGK